MEGELVMIIKRLMTQHIPGMLTCEEVDNFLYDFHEGQLSRAEKFKFKLHLSMCSECKDYVSQYKNTITLSQQAFSKVDSQDDDVPEQLIEVILKSRKQK